MPFLSLIIPAHNSSQTLPRLLDSIDQERIKNLEIIIVDDSSTDNTEKFFNNSHAPVRGNYYFYRLKKNLGPAHARNYGAQKANGEVLVFLDADVVVMPGTLKEVVRIFTEDKYKVAATGVWDKKQEGISFFPKFKALRDWSYWVNERKADSYYYLFSTRIAAIRRDVFLQLGGFNESFRGADVEDIEFTYRLAKKYRVDFNEKMRVFHQFEDFWPIAKKYFKRAYQWVEIFSNRKKFDPVATTGNEAITTISAVGLVGSLGLGLISLMSQMSPIRQVREIGLGVGVLFFGLSAVFLTAHLLGIRKFLKFVYQEEGLFFTIKSFFVGIALYLFIFTGAVWGMGKKYWSK